MISGIQISVVYCGLVFQYSKCLKSKLLKSKLLKTLDFKHFTSVWKLNFGFRFQATYAWNLNYLETEQLLSVWNPYYVVRISYTNCSPVWQNVHKSNAYAISFITSKLYFHASKWSHLPSRSILTLVRLPSYPVLICTLSCRTSWWCLRPSPSSWLQSSMRQASLYSHPTMD